MFSYKDRNETHGHPTPGKCTHVHTHILCGYYTIPSNYVSKVLVADNIESCIDQCVLCIVQQTITELVSLSIQLMIFDSFPFLWRPKWDNPLVHTHTQISVEISVHCPL